MSQKYIDKCLMSIIYKTLNHNAYIFIKNVSSSTSHIKNSTFMSFFNSWNLINRGFVIFYFYYNLNLCSYGQLLSLFYVWFYFAAECGWNKSWVPEVLPACAAKACQDIPFPPNRIGFEYSPDEKNNMTLISGKNILIILFVYQKALIRTFHTNLFYKITFVNSQHENINSKGDCTQKLVWKVCFKDFNI